VLNLWITSAINERTELDTGTQPAATGTVRCSSLTPFCAENQRPDVSTVFDTERALNVAQDSLNRPLDPVFRDCHLSDGQEVDDIDIQVTITITATETAELDRELGTLNAWAVIEQGGTSQCITTAAAAGHWSLQAPTGAWKTLRRQSSSVRWKCRSEASRS
jgi:hypothetical protein